MCCASKAKTRNLRLCVATPRGAGLTSLPDPRLIRILTRIENAGRGDIPPPVRSVFRRILHPPLFRSTSRHPGQRNLADLISFGIALSGNNSADQLCPPAWAHRHGGAFAVGEEGIVWCGSLKPRLLSRHRSKYCTQARGLFIIVDDETPECQYNNCYCNIFRIRIHDLRRSKRHRFISSEDGIANISIIEKSVGKQQIKFVKKSCIVLVLKLGIAECVGMSMKYNVLFAPPGRVCATMRAIKSITGMYFTPAIVNRFHNFAYVVDMITDAIINGEPEWNHVASLELPQ